MNITGRVFRHSHSIVILQTALCLMYTYFHTRQNLHLQCRMNRIDFKTNQINGSAPSVVPIAIDSPLDWTLLCKLCIIPLFRRNCQPSELISILQSYNPTTLQATNAGPMPFSSPLACGSRTVWIVQQRWIQTLQSHLSLHTLHHTCHPPAQLE